MASQATKIRVVRCPRCLKLLPELANYPVYQCGGCGTTLKAKKRKEDQEGEISEALAQNSAQNREPGHDSDNEELKCSSRKTTMCSTDTCEQHEHRDCDTEKSESGQIANGYSSSGELKWHEEEGLSSVAGGNSTADGNSVRGSDLENTSPDRQEITGQSKFISASQKPCDESIPSNKNASSSSEELDISVKIIRRYANLIGSRSPVQTPGATGNKIVSEDGMVGNKLRGGLVVSEPPELKINHAYDDKSPVQTPGATDDKIVSDDNMVGNKLRGGLVVSEPQEAKINHAYDGSVSSNDGWGDQVSDLDQVSGLHLNQYKKSYSGPQRVEEVISTGEGTTAEDMSTNNNIESKIEEQTQSRNLSLIPVTQTHGPVVDGNVSPDQDESTKNIRYGLVQRQVNSHGSTSLNPVQSWLGVNKEELKTRKPLGQRDSAAGYENSGPSEYNRHKEFLSSSLYEPKKLESVERNQMELMRKVDELRDQLNRSYSHSRKARERFPTNGNQQERQCPYYDRNQPEQEVLQCCDVTFPRQYPGTYRPSKSMPFQPQMPFSGNVVNCRHHANCPCSKPYEEDWQSLQKLPPPNFYNEGLCIAYPGQVCYSLYSSIPSSPEQHLHSRPPLHSRDVCLLPPDQIDRDHYVEKLHHRERRQPVKRHGRPIAGGAPFLICYSCKKLLYLPADSFHSRKRCHRLQCGSCSKVLMFSLHKRTHIAPYSLNTAAPPPGEIDNSRASTSMRNSTSTCGANNNPRGDPLSYSEDFELSICKSDSSEGDLPTNSVQASDSGNLSGNKTRLGKVQYEGSVTKTTGPALHLLMGYSSPSKMLKESGL